MEKSKLQVILEWLKENLPGLLAAFTFGYSKGAQGKEDLQKKLTDRELEIEKLRNQEALNKINGRRTARDIINDIARRRKP